MRIFRSVLFFCLCFVLAFGGCSSGNISDSESTPDLVKDGKSYYRIVESSSSSEIEKLALSELKYFFEMATDIVLPSIKDNEVGYSENSRFIVLGSNNLIAEAAGVSVGDGATSDSGYSLITKDDSVFILGKGDFGTLYGVYGFLNKVFGYEIFAEDEIKIETDVRNKKLFSMNITDTPDIPYRQANTGVLQENELLMRRFRANCYKDVFLLAESLFVHNFQIWVPLSEKAEHPLWFSENANYPGEQLCLSRDVDGLKDYVVRRMVEELDKNKNVSYLTFTQTDAAGWCECESCKQKKQQYGTDAAVYVQFTNLVAREVKTIMAEKGDPRDIQIGIFAYQSTEPAPVKTDSEGNYVAIDETVKPDDNIFIFIAPGEADYFRSLEDSANEMYLSNIEKWTAITNSVFMWTYKHFVLDYLTPFYNFRSMQENYQYLKEKNTIYLFDQGQHNQNVVTDWGPLKNYLEMNLMWDVDANMEELIDRFFENYFKQAATPMRELFEDYRLFMEYNIATNPKVKGICYPGLEPWQSQIDLRRETLVGWIDKIDEALESIASLKTSDAELYKKLKNRIILESISYRHLLIEKFSDSYFDDELLDMKKSFKADVLNLGIRQYYSEKTVDYLFDLMGV